VIAFPCGAGKTCGDGGMGLSKTLILTTSLTSVRQWRRELLDKTDLPEEAIAEYSGEVKATAPVTLHLNSHLSPLTGMLIFRTLGCSRHVWDYHLR